jgi:4-amino-4-deoxy-L-arabinose transferase-like glycosyltransferase
LEGGARRLFPVVLGIACAGFIIQIASTLVGQQWGYGYFIDELYYIACARRLDFGYVDHPPLAPAVLRLNLALFGDSLPAIRLPSALAAALTALTTGWLAARLGAGPFGQALASVCAVVPPILLVLFSFFSMNSFEILLWAAILVVAVLLVERNEPRLWLAFGVLAGIALENKHTVAVLALAILVGLILTPERKLLFTRWLWIGGAVAFLLFLPNLLWQIEHGFPSFEFYRNATLFKNRPLPPIQVVWNQILFMSPFTFPVWAVGLYFCFRLRRELRFVALAYLFLLASLVVSQSSRPDRLAGLYPALFACGSVAVESAVRSPRGRALVLGAVLAGSGVLGAISLPLLPPDDVSRALGLMGIDTQIERGEGKRAELPQWLADRIGWEELVEQVVSVYDSLPEGERERAVILAPSYGQAGALELLGEGRLPPVLSPHNTYHLWGGDELRLFEPGVLISLGYDAEDIGAMYESISQIAVYDCDYCMTWRDEMPIFIARGLKLTAAELPRAWEAAKQYE